MSFIADERILFTLRENEKSAEAIEEHRQLLSYNFRGYLKELG